MPILRIESESLNQIFNTEMATQLLSEAYLDSTFATEQLKYMTPHTLGSFIIEVAKI